MLHFFTTWTGLDFVMASVILLSLVIGIFRGFISEAISLFTWFFAFFAAFRFSPNMSKLLHAIISDDATRHVISVILIFILILLAGFIVKKLITMLIKFTGLGFFNRLLGMVFGMARGILFNIIILVMVQASAFQNDAWAKKSVIAPSYKPMVNFFNAQLPAQMSKVSSWVNHE